jgi:hypothetical protein
MSTVAVTKTKIRTRIIASMISGGQIGKSTALGEAVSPTLEYWGVEYSAVDLDGEHKTLSDRNDRAVLHEIKSADSFIALFNGTGKMPVEILDFPAQNTSFYLDCFERFKTLKFLEEKGVRMTQFIFASAAPSAISSAAMIVGAFGEQVDYVIVENPARTLAEPFYATAVSLRLNELGAKTLKLPEVTSTALGEIKQLSKEAGRWLSFQAAKSLLSGQVREDIEYFLDRSAERLEDIAEVILPDVALIKNKVVRTKLPKLVENKNRRLLGAV